MRLRATRPSSLLSHRNPLTPSALARRMRFCTPIFLSAEYFISLSTPLMIVYKRSHAPNMYPFAFLTHTRNSALVRSCIHSLARSKERQCPRKPLCARKQHRSRQKQLRVRGTYPGKLRRAPSRSAIARKSGSFGGFVDALSSALSWCSALRALFAFVVRLLAHSPPLQRTSRAVLLLLLACSRSCCSARSAVSPCCCYCCYRHHGEL